MQADETFLSILFNTKKDLQLMVFTARKKSFNTLYFSFDNIEFAFLSAAMTILAGRFSFEREEAILFIVQKLQIKNVFSM